MTISDIAKAGCVTRIRDGATFEFRGTETRAAKGGGTETRVLLYYPGPRHRSHQPIPGHRPASFGLDELDQFELGRTPLPAGE
jgi:hypothetical protein